MKKSKFSPSSFFFIKIILWLIVLNCFRTFGQIVPEINSTQSNVEKQNDDRNTLFENPNKENGQQAYNRVCMSGYLGKIMNNSGDVNLQTDEVPTGITSKLIKKPGQANMDICTEWDVIPGRIIIKFCEHKAELIRRNTQSSLIPGLQLRGIEDSLANSFEKAFPSKKYSWLLPNTFLGIFNIEDLAKIITTLESDPDVEYFEPDRVRVAREDWGTSNPNDPAWQDGSLWGMTRIHAPEGWDQQPASISPVRVAVMEGDACDLLHQDLVNQGSSVQNNPNPLGDHATLMAGIIAASGNNNMDVVGVANVELVSLTPGGIASGFVTSIAWAWNNGIDVINMSFHFCGCSPCESCPECTYSSPSLTEQEAIAIASDNIIFVAAAGNAGCNTDPNGNTPIPASYDGVLGVSALTQQDTRASFSNFGSYVDLTAPGVDVLSTIMDNELNSAGGTSVSAPQVAGSAGAVLVVRPNFDLKSINRLLTLTAEDIGLVGRDDDFGWGVVRVDRTLDAIADVYAESNPPYPWRQIGTLIYPFVSLTNAITAASTGGKVGIVRDSNFSGSITITKPCTLISIGGSSIIGQ